jgi:Zn-dependent protease
VPPGFAPTSRRSLPERCARISVSSGGFLESLTPQRLVEWFTYYVVLLFSVSVHESAHAWTALQMGDDTAASQGRVSLNPLVHIDPIGTVLMPILQLFVTQVPVLAWAKPTPVGAHNFKRLARGHILVAGAGPVSNMILAVLFTAVDFVLVRSGVERVDAMALYSIVRAGIVMNVGLAIFNLVPLPPLDGSWIVSWALPRPIAEKYDAVAEPYGPYILMILIFTGALGFVLRPLMAATLSVVAAIVER